MKKLLLGLFVFSFLIVGARVHASTLDDLMLKIDNLTKEITELKSSLKASAINVSVVAPITPTTDLTPRISVWSGKVNQHVEVDAKMWNTDPDGVSGAGIDKLTYCKKWYPNTVSVVQYKIETINAWHARYNIGDYPGTMMSYKCIQSNTTPTTSITVLSPNGGELYQAGQQITVKWKTENYTGNIAEINLVSTQDQYGGATLVKDISNNGQYTLVIPDSSYFTNNNLNFGKNFKIEIMIGGSQANNEVTDLSNNLFTIKSSITEDGCLNGEVYSSTTGQVCPRTSSITVLSPNGGEAIKLGDTVKITWKSFNLNNPTDTVLLFLKDSSSLCPDEKTGCSLTASSITNTGSYLWDTNSKMSIGEGRNISVKPGSTNKIVACVNNLCDESDNYFTITSSTTPIITSISPSKGSVGSIVTINGSGFTTSKDINYNSISFVGSTSLTSPYIAPIDGEYDLNGVVSPNGKKLSFVIPSQLSRGSENGQVTYTNIIPGTYYFIVDSAGGRSNAKSFTVVSKSFVRTLKIGTKGEDVKILQAFLNLPADGSFGYQTQKKVMEWQAENGLKVDGLFGSQSWGKAGL